MADIVTTAIYKMGLDPSSYEAGAAKVVAAGQRVIASGEGVVVVEERVARAHRLTETSLERKIARLDPVFAAEQRYARAQEMVQRLEEEGIGTAANRLRLLDLEQQQYAKAIGTSNAVGAAISRNTQLSKQLSFQLFDIAQGIPLAFQSPLYGLQNLAIQTGQISQLYIGQGGLKQAFADTTAVAKSLGAALLAGLVSPLGLAGAATAALGVAALALFVNERSHARGAEEALKKHIDLIGRIKGAYKDADEAVGRYGTESLRVLQALDVEQKRIVSQQLNKEALRISSGSELLTSLGDPKTMDALLELNKQAQVGAADWKKFGDALVTALSDPAIASNERKIIQGLLEIAAEATKTQVALKQLVPPSFRQAEQQSMRDLGRFMTVTRAELLLLQQSHQVDLIAMSARSPGAKGDVAEQRQRIELIGEEGTAQEHLDRVRYAGEIARAEAEHALSEAQRERMQSLDETMRAAQLDIELIGKSASETAHLRMENELLAALRAEAAANGIAMDTAEVNAIKAKAAEMGKLIELQQRLTLRNDLSFDRSQIFRSPTEQRVADEMRSIYGDDYLAHMKDFEAQQIRINERLAEFNEIGLDVTKGFISDLRSGLEEGASFWDAFGTAGENALQRITDKLIDMAIDNLWSNAFGGAKGGAGGLGGIFGALFGKGGLNYGGGVAPVGAGLFHDGGMVGSGGAMRYVHPAYFDDAPRMHGGGIAGNEVAAILQRGERVLPVGASGDSGKAWNFTVNNYGNDDVDIKPDGNGMPVVSIAQRSQAERNSRTQKPRRIDR